MIVVVSHAGDDHAMAVLGALERAGHSALLIDTAHYPGETALRLEHTGEGPRWWVRLSARDAWIDLRTCKAAWWRRPQPYVLDPALDSRAAQFSYAECHEAISGLWAAMPATWINDPYTDERAAHKPYQLAVASAVGLCVPRTCITNDPASARQFADSIGVERTIYKTFRAASDAWRETRVLRHDELDLLDSVAIAPVIFQERVDAVADVRVIIVGDKIFATEVSVPDGSYAVDYRMSLATATFAPVQLPVALERKLQALMQRLGLVYGAIDLMRTADDRYVFLEVNPSGEWLFVSEPSGQPITQAVADHLHRLDGG